MTTAPYIPDHIRLKRTDRLVHVKESLLMVYRRKLPLLWESAQVHDQLVRLHLEISLIDAELHKRMMKTPAIFRPLREPAYIADRS